MKTMRFSAVLLAVCVLFCSLPARAEAADVVRLHIVANSDSPEDQAIKLLVRDALLACEAGSMRDIADSRPLAEAALMRDAEAMLCAARRVLSEHGVRYGVTLALGSYMFPDRSYAGVTYPAGEYRALRVVLGEGAGKNWWCVMFPPLCILELDLGEIDSEDMDGAELESFVADWLKGACGGELWKRIKDYLR